DVYSLGVTLYELLTLKPAFASNDRPELLQQVAFEEPRPPRGLNKAIPVELETIVLKAIEKKLPERYATAKDLADDLERWLKDEPIGAKQLTLLQWGWKWARRQNPMVWAAAFCCLLAVALIGASLSLFSVLQAQRRAKVGEILQEANQALASGNEPQA